MRPQTYNLKRASSLLRFYRLCLPTPATPFPANKRQFRSYAWKQMKSQQLLTFATDETTNASPRYTWCWSPSRRRGDETSETNQVVVTYDNMWRMSKTHTSTVAMNCVETLYRESERTMPDQFFFVKLDPTQPYGYDASASGLVRDRLVINRRGSFIRTMAQACTENLHASKYVADANPFEAYLTPAPRCSLFMLCDYRANDLFTNDQVCVAASPTMDYQAAMFEHTLSKGGVVHVHPPNLFCDSVRAIQQVLIDEVNVHNCCLESDTDGSHSPPSATYTVFPPIVIAGPTLDAALETVACDYDVTDYARRERPRDKNGAPWMRRFRYTHYWMQRIDDDHEFEDMWFTNEEEDAFGRQWAVDPRNPSMRRDDL